MQKQSSQPVPAPDHHLPERRRCFDRKGNLIDEADYRIVTASFPYETWKVDSDELRIVSLMIWEGGVPEELFELSALKCLKISSRRVESVPSCIANLQNLKELIFGSRLQRLPDEIGALENLQRLSLHSSQISSLPPSIGQLKNLKALILSCSKKLLSLPTEIGGLKNLESLEVGNTPLTSLPDSIGSLKRLRSLWATNTRISKLPDSIGDLCNLENLLADAQTNLLTIPPSIGRLQNLQAISLGVVRDLPKEIVHLTNLKALLLVGHVANNKEMTIRFPESMANLQNLEHISIFCPTKFVEDGSLATIRFDARRLAFCQRLPKLTELFCVPFAQPNNVMLDLVRATPSLEVLAAPSSKGHPCTPDELPDDLVFALTCNTFRKHCSPKCVDDKLWPHMLAATSRSLKEWKIFPHDAVYQLLLDGRASFVQVLTNRQREEQHPQDL